MTRHDMTTASMITCAGCKHSYASEALFCPNCGTPKARDSAPADALIGKVLGERFQILDRIGQGGSGSIYRAEHVTLRRKVAIKVLHNELSRDDLAVERFRREATTVAEIDNEHIVEIHDFGRTPDGRLYLAMELLEGETLDSVLVREKQLSVERATDILIQVGEALMEAHAIGYVHRDLRPRNIYLAVRRGKANFVKLLDFGLAKLVDTDAQAASTSLGMTFGDPRYMSPEQARGDRIDRRADIYQLGCIAYEMLTGAPPFSGNRVFDILSKQVTEIPAPLPTRRAGIPLWLEAACAKMLAKDAENRFATTTRMVEALRLGIETGQVMEDEIARRRESIPPPSVSRVMQKMGIPAPVDPPAAAPASGGATMKGHLEGPGVPMPAANPPVTGKETLRGHLDPLGLPTTPPSSGEPQRRRTGTPQVGVPVQPPVAGFIDRSTFADGFANHHASQPTPSVQVASGAHVVPPSAPVVVSTAPPAMPPPAAPSAQVITPSAPIPALVPPAGSAPVGTSTSASRSDASPSRSEAGVSAAGRSKRGSQQPGPSDSSAWFDDGERASEEAEKIRSRKLISPSSTDMSLYDEPPRRRMWPLLLVGTLALGAVIAIAVVATRGKDKPAKREQPDEVATAPAVAPADVPPSQIISPDGSAAVPATGSAVTPPPVPPTTAVTKATTKSSSTSSSSSSSSTKKSSGSSSNKVTTTDDAASRRPSGGGFFDPPATTPTTTPDPTPTITPTPTPAPDPQPTGVSGTAGPVDPYGGSTDAPPSDGASPDKKAEFFANLGKQQLASGDTAGAAASFKKALELDSKNVAAVIGMGEIALRQGLFGDAIAHLKKATKLAPKSSYVWTLLGEAYLGTNNNAVAADTFKKALQLDPDNTRAREGFDEAQSKVPPATDD